MDIDEEGPQGRLRPRQDTNLTDIDLSCQAEPPSPTGTFAPSESAPEEAEKQTTAPSWTHLFCMALDTSEPFGDAGGSSGADMTPERCGRACCGAMYFGVYAGTECGCVAGPGHLIPSADGADGRCDAACAGDEGETCGGEEGVDVYVVDRIASPEDCEAQRGNGTVA